MTLVGLSGYARSGKDAVGAFMIEDGWERRAFADALKAIAFDLGWDGEKDEVGRKLLQTLGQSVRENISTDAWIVPVLANLPEKLVITDVRYKNEAEALRAAGGILVRVTRPGVGPANGHISETDLDDVDPDVFLNNTGTLEDLGGRVRRWIQLLD